jgi:hypothetical protein
MHDFSGFMAFSCQMRRPENLSGMNFRYGRWPVMMDV